MYETTPDIPSNEGFLRSLPGRLAVGTGAFNILGMGVVALAGPGEHAYSLIAVVILASIIVSIFTVGLSIERDEPDSTMAMLLSFPFLAGVSLAGLYGAISAGTLVGAVLVIAGGLLLAAAAGASKLLAPRPQAHEASAVNV